MAVRGREIEPGALAVPGELLAPRRAHPALHALRLVWHKPLGAFGLLVILLMGVAAATAPVMARYEPTEPFRLTNPNYDPNSIATEALSPTTLDGKAAPSWEHWFGTDNAGRDIWARVVWGARRSLGIGIGALLIATVAGGALGIVSAHFGGKFDTAFQRLLDAIQAFPALLILILLVSITEATIRTLIIGLGFVGITQVSRIVRSTVFSLREMPYVEAARVIGATDLRIMLQHLLPNTVAPIIVVFTIGLGSVIVAEASLAFLGLAPPGVSWGEMLNSGRNFINSSPWQAAFSGGAITLAVLGFNLAGDALRDVLDPRLRI